jgi:hypothetical protein
MEETMKNLVRVIMGTVMTLMVTTPALAVDTTKTYSSGILVGVFLGFCALIVVVQLMPTIMLLFGFIKGMFKSSGKHAKSKG